LVPQKESPAEAGQGLILEGNQDEDTAIDTQIATVLRPEGFSRRNPGSVFEMSQQSNFRNRAVEEKTGVRYRPNRHG
jgi:hypothetical protein